MMKFQQSEAEEKHTQEKMTTRRDGKIENKNAERESERAKIENKDQKI